MNPFEIIKKYYDPESIAYYILIKHSSIVAEKALKVAEKVRHMNPDFGFIQEAAMLHDIGILFTDVPEIGCHGNKPYICHGFLGRELLEKEGLPNHALICERHVGVGITLEDIEKKHLPLPKRDMVPTTIEEKTICFADKFFSKNSVYLLQEKPLELVRKKIARIGEEKLKIFDEWVDIFGT